jgi:hypothetical protein
MRSKQPMTTTLPCCRDAEISTTEMIIPQIINKK